MRRAVLHRLGQLTTAVLVLTLSTSLAAAAQPPAIRDAERLRGDGNLAAAATVLRAHLALQPDDGDAARMLAQTLYWLRDVEGARRVYDDAMRRHPADTALRLQYGRMLVETGARTLATDLLTPLSAHPATRAEANTLLGTLAYWQGDLTRARRLLAEALATTPDQPEARRLLGEIDATSAPWVRLSAGARHDDQPLDRLAGGFEAGWFLTPLVPIAVRTEPSGFRLPGGRVQRLWSTEAALSAYMPRSRVDVEVAGGVLRRHGDADPVAWLGRGTLGVRVTPTIALRARVERRPYLSTTASLTSPVTSQTARALVAWTDRRGWLAEAGLDAQRFPDENVVRAAYGWLLAPVVHKASAELQVGYAWGWSDADDSRFTLTSPIQPVTPADPSFDVNGHYAPYYTPSRQTIHSVTAAGAVGRSSGARLRVSGAYGVRATEQAPLLTVVDGAVTRVFYERTYSPWNVRTSIAGPVHDRLTIGVGAEIGRTAFYRWASGDLQLTYRFVRRDIPRMPGS